MIIPTPSKTVESDGHFLLRADTKILFTSETSEVRQVARQIASFLAVSTGYNLTSGPTVLSSSEENSIFLTTRDAPERLGEEGYQLDIKPEKIVIRATGAAGLFYGFQSLRQLLPEAIESHSVISHDWAIPCMTIEDVPRFAWRGMHLDVCRHFFDIDSVKKYIDYLAMYKMNVFHWHLTEDQGWRVEIKEYPELEEISSWRNGTKYNYWQSHGDLNRYGGCFKQKQIREIVAYAKDRFITIVPEIEMPGHAQAVLAAYPELSCTGGPHEVWTDWGVSKEVYCAGNDKVFEFLQNVIDEILELFPGKYIHIGGDECPKDRWKACPKCQKRMQDEGLADEDELQSYFIKRIARYIQSRNRSIIGWDEIIEGGLAEGTAVMSWRGIEGGIKASQMKHKVVMTPYQFTYFDHKPEPFENPAEGPGRDYAIDLKTVYDFDVTKDIPQQFQKYIMGGQGCVWTEYINNQQELEYMLLPRLCALAEKIWSPQDKYSWDDFSERISSHQKRFDVMGAAYCKRL